MQLYLDTSIYAFIDQGEERAKVARLLESRGATVRASATNMIEAAAIADDQSRAMRARTLCAIASGFEHPPSDYLEAQEVLNEIRRCRPEWLRPRSRSTRVKHLLRARARQWVDLCAGADPRDVIMAPYGDVVRPLSRLALHQQQALRRGRLAGNVVNASVVLDDPHLQAHVDGLGVLERYTRLVSMRLWQRALGGAVELCDLRDWVSPHLRPMEVQGLDFERFWLRDADLTHLPRTALASALAYYQSDYRPTQGTLEDLNHGLHVLSCDLFLTSDVGLAGALQSALDATRIKLSGRPVLLKRAAKSAAEEIERALLATTTGSCSL